MGAAVKMTLKSWAEPGASTHGMDGAPLTAKPAPDAPRTTTWTAAAALLLRARIRSGRVGPCATFPKSYVEPAAVSTPLVTVYRVTSARAAWAPANTRTTTLHV